MTFAGWHRVAENLEYMAAAPGPYLNEGQCNSLRALAVRIPKHGVVIADEVGMGKTRIAVALGRAVAMAGGRVAILIPSTLGFQWQEELRLGGMHNVPDVVRSLWGYLQAWSSESESNPWFEQPALLISHGFVNWRLGAMTQRWRFELLPMLAGLAQHALDGSYPHGFKTMSERSDEWVYKAAHSIADFCVESLDPKIRASFHEIGGQVAWGTVNSAANYAQGGAARHQLQAAVGLGLGPFDLVIIDEAHKSRGDDAGLSRLLEDTLLLAKEARRLAMTATPVEFGAHDWDQLLARVSVDAPTRAGISKSIDQYGLAARRVRLAWRSSPEACDAYVSAARAFEAGLKPFVIRRDKRSDAAVVSFRCASGRTGEDAYRKRTEISISPLDLSLGWRRAVCAAEALSFVAHGRDDPAAKRLRLTLANGHGIATRLDACITVKEDVATQPGDQASEPVISELASMPALMSPGELKRLARVAWWQGVVGGTARAKGAIYEHPAILAAVEAIEVYDRAREKVLVFGRFTAPMRALVNLLNARALLRALDTGIPWPQRQLGSLDEDIEAAEAAHRQLLRPGQFDVEATNALLARQYTQVERRREALRTSLYELILQGLPTEERNGRALAEAARRESGSTLALLAAAIDQLLDEYRLLSEDMRGNAENSERNTFSASEIAQSFLALVIALRDRGGEDPDASAALDPSKADDLWRTLAVRLDEEYGTERGRFARLMYGGTSLPTRRTLQLGFNRQQTNPRVLVAQSLVGREGLNLHQACRVVVLLHPEWNPGVVEQQIGRVDRVGSHWEHMLGAAVLDANQPLPCIEIRPVIFEGTYDEHHWEVLNQRWDDFQAQLHGIVVPHRMRADVTVEERCEIHRLDAAAPNFEP